MKKWLLFFIWAAFNLLLIPTAQSQSPIPNFQTIRIIERGHIYPNRGYTNEQFGFNPDGTQIAAGADDETTVKVWEIATGAVLFNFEFSSATVSWSPDGRYIVATGPDTEIRVWDAATGDIHLDYPSTPCYSAHYVAWSPDSRQFVTSCFIIYDVETGEVVRDFGVSWDGFTEILWSPDGSMIATTFSVLETNTIVIWSLDGEQLDTYWGYGDAAWSPDSTRLAAASQIRDVGTGLPVTIIPELYVAIAWHPNGEWVTDVENDGTVRLWDAESGELVTAWQPFSAPECEAVDHFEWSTDGRRFAMNCYRGKAYSADTSLIIGEIEP